jgi:hypothetical protein
LLVRLRAVLTVLVRDLRTHDEDMPIAIRNLGNSSKGVSTARSFRRNDDTSDHGSFLDLAIGLLIAYTVSGIIGGRE